ncbi:MAG: hypothetical protein GXO39_10110 [Thermotogae bacterium]|nr:hypothetical protein [Thermotogota bacterium]
MNRVAIAITAVVSLAVGIFIGSIGFYYLKGSKGRVEETAPKTEVKLDTLEVVGDVVIAAEDLKSASQIPGLNTNQDLKRALEKIALFYNAAKEKNITDDPEARRMAYWADKSVYADLYYQKYVVPLIKVDTAKVLDYIQKHKDEFSKEVAMLMVVYRDPKLTDTLRKLLKDGSYAANLMLEEFAKAGKIGVQPSPYQNLGLGRFSMDPKDYEKLKKAKVGDVIGPFQVAPGTYALAKIADIRRVSISKLGPDVKSVVYQYLLDQRKREVEDSLIKIFRKKYAGGR